MSTTHKAKTAMPMRIVAGAILAATFSGAALLNAATAIADMSDCGARGGSTSNNGPPNGHTDRCCFPKPIDDSGNFCEVYNGNEWVQNDIQHVTPPSTIPPAPGPAAPGNAS